MLTLTWQIVVFICETIPLLPVYMYILFGITITHWKNKSQFKSPYYILILSQGLADIFTILVFSTLVLARYFEIGNLFIFNLATYGTDTFYANSGAFCFTIRIVGVFFITIQRYLAVCKQHGSLNQKINKTSPFKLIFVHWFTAILIYTPAFIASDATFENEQTLFLLTSERHAQVFSVTVAACFVVIGTSVIIMYGKIAMLLFRSRLNETTTRKSSRSQDIRISIHVLILIIFSMIVCCYYLGEFCLSFDQDRTKLKAFRLYYPTISGNFSFINPISLIVSNFEVQKRLFCCFRKKQTNHCFTSQKCDNLKTRAANSCHSSIVVLFTILDSIQVTHENYDAADHIKINRNCDFSRNCARNYVGCGKIDVETVEILDKACEYMNYLTGAFYPCMRNLRLKKDNRCIAKFFGPAVIGECQNWRDNRACLKWAIREECGRKYWDQYKPYWQMRSDLICDA